MPPKRATSSSLTGLAASTHHNLLQLKPRSQAAQVKRLPPSLQGAAAKKRSALGDITNNKEDVNEEGELVRKPQKKWGAPHRCVVTETALHSLQWIEADALCSPPARPSAVIEEAEEVVEEAEEVDHGECVSESSEEAAPPSQVPSVVGGAPLKEVGEEEEGRFDPLLCTEYAEMVFLHMKRREERFRLAPYMERQPDLNANMRAILVDWMVEVQENFQLNHETLYLAVKLVDHFLSLAPVARDKLQLLGATCVFIAAKFDEVSPPSTEDLLFICDDAYSQSELLAMERRVLQLLNFDLNIPIAYRPLRRYAKVCGADMRTLTLARYACESTLACLDFVGEGAARLAAACLGLALRMTGRRDWPEELRRHSGYEEADALPLMARINELITSAPADKLAAVYSKYSHRVFFEVAKIPPVAPADFQTERRSSTHDRRPSEAEETRV